MSARRWFWTKVRGPLCDAGTALGADGCLKAATHTTLPFPAGWTRGFRWCPEHRDAASVAIGLSGYRQEQPR